MQTRQWHVYTLITLSGTSRFTMRRLYYVSINVYRPYNAKFASWNVEERWLLCIDSFLQIMYLFIVVVVIKIIIKIKQRHVYTLITFGRLREARCDSYIMFLYVYIALLMLSLRLGNLGKDYFYVSKDFYASCMCWLSL